MITAEFTNDSFTVSGHSGYAPAGADIVCASVSSMTMLVCNAITERFGGDAKVTVDEKKNRISLRLNEPSEAALMLIASLRFELTDLSRNYPDNIKVIEKGK